MSDRIHQTTGLRTEVRQDGHLQLSLETSEIERPAPDEIIVEMAAAPLHPADISLLLGPADLSSTVAIGHGVQRTLSATIAPERMAGLATRVGKSLSVGNEGSGVVVEAGQAQKHLVGKNVAVMGGGMLTQYRKVPISDALPLPDGVPVTSGAAVLINPLTALAMLETMRDEGHTALVHTAAASSLGQMLNRICLEDGVGLVNVVRRPEQAQMLRQQGARHVCDSSSPDFVAELSALIAETGATLAFDAVSGGSLASQILAAMERNALASLHGYSRYGSKVRKQIYFYGGMDSRPTELNLWAYGMTWSAGSWLIFDQLPQMAPERSVSLRERISRDMLTTFACDFAGELSLSELLDPENLKRIAARSTGQKYLINPSIGLER
ncbi:NADH oxidase [Sphingobium sp.]|uniref:NADH oxidase n=1 Tax=Sphingobium sp. TaxID=1912891 RepID=UPI0028BE4DED|nr:NADH oxidase [Sphingobium sp.]